MTREQVQRHFAAKRARPRKPTGNHRRRWRLVVSKVDRDQRAAREAEASAREASARPNYPRMWVCHRIVAVDDWSVDTCNRINYGAHCTSCHQPYEVRHASTIAM